MFQPVQPEQKFDYAEYRAKETEGVLRHHQSVGSGAILPLVQAGVSGIVLGVSASIVSWAAGWGNPWRVGLVAAALVISLAWLSLLSNWLGFWRTLETILKADLNGDGSIGEPEPAEPQTVRVELRSEDGRHTQFADIPTSSGKLADLARGILDGQPFSETAWSGAGALFSRSEFRAVRDAFMARGWARWKDPAYPQQGIEFSGPGRAVLRQFASQTDSPTLRRRRA